MHDRPAKRTPGQRALLQTLLSERNQYPDRAPEIDRRIFETFERQVAVLVIDMCGFSRLTASHGVIHFLAMVHQMDRGARPAIVGNGGQVVKQEADNLFACFDAPAAALEAALDVRRAFEAMNTVLPDERKIQVSIGIGFGAALLIDGADMFGHEMNLACKLGEDVAGPMEILLTAAAHARLPADRYQFTADDTRIGGNPVAYYRFVCSIDAGAAHDAPL